MNRKRPNFPEQEREAESAKRQKSTSSLAATLEETKRRIAQQKALLEKVQASSSSSGIIINKDGKMELNFANTALPKASELATVKANVKEAEKVELITKKMKESREKNPYLIDSHVAAPSSKHIRPTIKFVQQGKFIQQAEKMRTQQKLEQLKYQIEKTARKSGLEDLVDDNSVPVYNVPKVEWWDAQFILPNGDINREMITNLIQHPVLVEPPGVQLSSQPTHLIMTKREKKRARRLRRMEALKERQEKIRLGLLPPEEPKLKISNMMRVLGNEAVMDPTAMEQIVKKQVQERLEKHLRENEERKLTPEERSEKNRLKHTEDTTLRTHVAVYAIKELTHPSHCFKVTKNADDHHLTGTAIIYEDLNIVIVEGGPKGIRKYNNLMMRRIDWNLDRVVEDDGEKNKCCLVWEGVMAKAGFGKLRLVKCKTVDRVKEALGSNYVHLYEMAKAAIKS